MMTDQSEPTKQETIRFAYEELSDAEKIQIDLQVKRLLDFVAGLNKGRKVSHKAIFTFSRDNALELIYELGRLMNGGNDDITV